MLIYFEILFNIKYYQQGLFYNESCNSNSISIRKGNWRYLTLYITINFFLIFSHGKFFYESGCLTKAKD